MIQFSMVFIAFPWIFYRKFRVFLGCIWLFLDISGFHIVFLGCRGYYQATKQVQGTGNWDREQGAGNREQGTGFKAVSFGGRDPGLLAPKQRKQRLDRLYS